MRWLRGIGWTALVIATLLIAAAPELLTMATPQRALVVDRAILLSGTEPARQVPLPHTILPRIGNPLWIRYDVEIGAQVLGGNDPSLYIPVTNRRVSLQLDGEDFYDSSAHAIWVGPVVATPILVRLPRRALAPGPHRLTIIVEAGPFIGPTYLSQLYLGPEAELSSSFKWQRFLSVDAKAMSFAAQVMLGFGILLAFLLRPRTPLLSWLAAFEIIGVIAAIGMFVGFQPAVRPFLPYVVALIPGWGLLAVGVALVLVDVRPPRFLVRGIVALTAILLVCAAIGTPVARITLTLSAVTMICAGAVGAAAVIAWGALRRRNVDAYFMLPSAIVMAWFLVRDAYVAATLPRHSLSIYAAHAGLVFVGGLVAVLMRRMAYSFDELDRSNENLNHKLAEREAELAVLARQEQMEASRLVREQERGRLTHDLHDGISGHLVSIIALAERAEARPIEQAARDALNDLRLVIYSLDLGDGELPLALANFRERLIPQLHRLGVELDWSTANLPDVSGVTPGNALTILRILQEAITNALKHGPARRIRIRGGASADGLAAITIENDGRPFVVGSGGRGLDNMRRRAERLEAKLYFESLDQGLRVTLLLPRQLPDVEY